MYSVVRFFLIVAYLLLLYCIVLVMIMGWPATGWFLGAFLFLRGLQKGRRYLTTLGSARWATEREIERAGMLGGTSGLILGRLPNEKGEKQ
jgi:hypothetical protein